MSGPINGIIATAAHQRVLPVRRHSEIDGITAIKDQMASGNKEVMAPILSLSFIVETWSLHQASKRNSDHCIANAYSGHDEAALVACATADPGRGAADRSKHC